MGEVLPGKDGILVKLRLEIEVECEDLVVNRSDPEEWEWFLRDVIAADPANIDECLALHSNAIGDTIGAVRVLRVLEVP